MGDVPRWANDEHGRVTKWGEWEEPIPWKRPIAALVEHMTYAQFLDHMAKRRD